jgi:F-type H+-transporting ATPase subunit delta
MSELATLARPYACAVFKRAKETDSKEKWSESLAFMTQIVVNKELADVFSNPKVSNDRIAQLVIEICQEHLDVEGINFLKLLLQNDRLTLLPFIAKNFEALKAEDEGYIETEVETAFAFTKEAEKKLNATLEKTFNKQIHMNVTVDKTLIGGVLVRAGDRVIDGSIRGQLQQLQKALM